MERNLVNHVRENRTHGESFVRALSGLSRITKKSVERKAEATFGPVMWASDFLWDAIAYQGFGCFVLYPLRKKVQALARKYRHCPHAFAPACNELVNQYILDELRSNRGFRWDFAHLKYFEQRMQRHFKEKVREKRALRRSSTICFSEDLSRRQLIALDEIDSKVRRLFRGSLIEKEPKRFLATFTSLAAARPGPRPSPIAKRIHLIDQKARAEGRHLTYSAIAKRVFTEYQRSSSYDRRHFRETVRLALRKK